MKVASLAKGSPGPEIATRSEPFRSWISSSARLDASKGVIILRVTPGFAVWQEEPNE
jgi:hypothetical protein